MTSQRDQIKRILTRPEPFSRVILRRPLRNYQLPAAQAIVESVLRGRGLTFAVMMSRQSGKNEISAHIEALLMNLYRQRGGSIVKASPSFKPQTVNSMIRLVATIEGSILPPPKREQGYMVSLQRARALFFSAAPSANVVGATASILLEADEAQDIDQVKWDKEFAPMGASTNVTRVLWGTAWTKDTMLARTIRALRAQEKATGRQLVFETPWQTAAHELPAYGDYVRSEIARLGPNHPLIRTQYFLEEIDADAGMFPPTTQRLMQGNHTRETEPTPGSTYAMLIDVAGASEIPLSPTDLPIDRRDATTAMIVEITHTSALPGTHTYLLRQQYQWTDWSADRLLEPIVALALRWQVHTIVIDATAIGAGLTAFLQNALRNRVQPFIFTGKSKSDLGWNFLGACNSGRFQIYRDDGEGDTRLLWDQIKAADYTVLDGPNKLMRWSVSDPLLHDDLLIACSLCATLDQHTLTPYLESQIIAPDPIL